MYYVVFCIAYSAVYRFMYLADIQLSSTRHCVFCFRGAGVLLPLGAQDNCDTHLAFHMITNYFGREVDCTGGCMYLLKGSFVNFSVP